jgi:DNA mismatch repair protein MutH
MLRASEQELKKDGEEHIELLVVVHIAKSDARHLGVARVSPQTQKEKASPRVVQGPYSSKPSFA